MTSMMMTAVLTSLSIAVWSDDGGETAERLPAVRRGDARGSGHRRGVESSRTKSTSRIGIAAVIAAACATLRGGGSLVQAFAEQSDRGFAVNRLTEARLRELLAARALPKETSRQINRVAAEIAVAARISDRLGCPAASCLEAVGDTYRRSRKLEDLRAQVFAVPKATIRLLSGLPAVTILLGELMGSHPIAFLLGSPQGLMCLGLGLCCYAAGLVWTRTLLRGLDSPS
ncbi:pilus assembly protein [Bifidobacterium amazonense]|uniref:Pilus assembly protein n=1 Tax=Bifidobacterium amazonense TaxID=2809027 RepID=A0ABS9VX99_9BIFI|nr:pilus assembly protein [Bifidobacterium amazonense]MCH9276604.1 pilus assembly protein [Bifidobacterium amazonense]